MEASNKIPNFPKVLFPIVRVRPSSYFHRDFHLNNSNLVEYSVTCHADHLTSGAPKYRTLLKIVKQVYLNAKIATDNGTAAIYRYDYDAMV